MYLNRLRRRLTTTAAATLLTAATLLAPGSGAYAAGAVNIVAKHSGMCAAVSGGSVLEGAAIVQRACVPSYSQLWYLVYLGMGHYAIQSANSSKCMDALNPDLVMQKTCTWSGTQSWLIGREPNTDQNTWWTFKPDGVRCLEVRDAAMYEGVGYRAGFCGSPPQSNQIFRIPLGAAPPR
jgi:hypothetical protein